MDFNNRKGYITEDIGKNDLVAAAICPDLKYEISLSGPQVAYILWLHYCAAACEMSCNTPCTKCNTVVVESCLPCCLLRSFMC